MNKFTPSSFLRQAAIIKGGRSAYKFRKSQICEIADLNNLLDLRIIRKWGTLRICALLTEYFLWVAVFRKSANKYLLALQT
jgi:hypothetical protein